MATIDDARTAFAFAALANGMMTFNAAEKQRWFHYWLMFACEFMETHTLNSFAYKKKSMKAYEGTAPTFACDIWIVHTSGAVFGGAPGTRTPIPDSGFVFHTHPTVKTGGVGNAHASNAHFKFGHSSIYKVHALASLVTSWDGVSAKSLVATALANV